MRWCLDVKQAASLMGVHPDTVYLWLAEKRIPGRKVGGKWLILQTDLLLFLKGEEKRRRDARDLLSGVGD